MRPTHRARRPFRAHPLWARTVAVVIVSLAAAVVVLALIAAAATLLRVIA